MSPGPVLIKLEHLLEVFTCVATGTHVVYSHGQGKKEVLSSPFFGLGGCVVHTFFTAVREGERSGDRKMV
jgi:hypothetical protein